MRMPLLPVADASWYVVPSPFGRLTLRFSSGGLSGLWFPTMALPADAVGVVPQPVATDSLRETRADLPSALRATLRWLDAYFAHDYSQPLPPLDLRGTPFRLRVWQELLRIAPGTTVSYGDIARRIAADQGTRRLSAQAVGGAVGANPVSLIVPCHRVVGSRGQLTGYAGGLPLKSALLRWEGADAGGWR